MTPQTPQISAFKRLKQLPALFSMGDLKMVHGFDSDYCQTMTNRWMKAELIKPVGPRAGWYYNLVVDPNSPENKRGEAIKSIYRTPVLIGAEVLHDAGWTDQIPQILTVAIPKNKTHTQIYGVQVFYRDKKWFETISEFVKTGEGVYDLDQLPPEIAMGDLLAYKEGWKVDSTDFDIDLDEVDLNLLEISEVIFDVNMDFVRESSPYLEVKTSTL